MPSTSIVLQKRGRGDDVIRLIPRGSLVSVEYRDGDRKGCYEFTLSHSTTHEYVSNLLDALVVDAEPFEYIQILPCTGPSILFYIWDLDGKVRNLVTEMINMSICGSVTYNSSG